MLPFGVIAEGVDLARQIPYRLGDAYLCEYEPLLLRTGLDERAHLVFRRMEFA